MRLFTGISLIACLAVALLAATGVVTIVNDGAIAVAVAICVVMVLFVG